MYQEIFQKLKKELESEELQELPNDFYEKIERYIASLKKKIKDPNPLCSKIASIELKNVIIMTNKLKEIREIKMAHKQLKEITKIALEQKIMEQESREEEITIKKETEPREKEVVKQPIIPARQRGLLLVRVFDDVPEISDTDGFIYGPFQKGDVVYLPEEIAMTLITRGIARKVQDELEEGIKFENTG
ncbi:MAG: hypothetical protein QW128_08740 [Thermoprotei archaeon]